MLMRHLLLLSCLLPTSLMAAIAFEEIGTQEEISELSTPDVTVTLSGTPADDELLVGMCWRDSSQDSTNAATSFPDGWTPLSNISTAYTNDRHRRMDYGYKVASSESGASYTFTPSLDASEEAICHILVFSGVDTSNPIDTASTTSHRAETVDGAPDPPSITTTTNGAWVVAFGGLIGTTATRSCSLTNYTIRTDNSDAQDHTFTCIGTREITSAGAENPAAMSVTNIGSENDAGAAVIAIRPESAGSLLFYVR